MPEAICFDQVATLVGVTAFFWFLNRSQSGPYGQNSMIMQKHGGCVQTPLNFTMFGWSSLRKFLMSVSFMSDTFFTAISSLLSFPEKTAPCPPQPRYFKSFISSKEISQSSKKTQLFHVHFFNCLHTFIIFNIVDTGFSQDEEYRSKAAEDAVQPALFEREVRLRCVWRTVVLFRYIHSYFPRFHRNILEAEMAEFVLYAQHAEKSQEKQTLITTFKVKIRKPYMMAIPGISGVNTEKGRNGQQTVYRSTEINAVDLPFLGVLITLLYAPQKFADGELHFIRP